MSALYDSVVYALQITRVFTACKWNFNCFAVSVIKIFLKCVIERFVIYSVVAL